MTESEHRPYRTRTSVLFASAAPRAVILRRGPRKHYHLVAWNLDDDTFEHGQWMKGNVRLADLSPSGDKLIYFAEQFHASARNRVRPGQASGPYDPLRHGPARKVLAKRPGRRTPRYRRALGPAGRRSALPCEIDGSWTAVSTPPYFSALALWPSFGRWTGGGTFLRNRHLVIWERHDRITPIENVPMPTGVRIRPCEHVGLRRPSSAYAPGIAETAEHTRIAASLLEQGLPWVDWINLRRGDDMLFAGDGRIFRLPRWRDVAEADRLAAARALIDLRDLSFTLMPAPDAALRW